MLVAQLPWGAAPPSPLHKSETAPMRKSSEDALIVVCYLTKSQFFIDFGPEQITVDSYFKMDAHISAGFVMDVRKKGNLLNIYKKKNHQRLG